MAIMFVLVDALRSDYLQFHNSAPFLSRCSEKGTYVENVEPSLGFCERVEILTGVGFPENGYFSAIGRDERHIGPYVFLKAIPHLWRNSHFMKMIVGKVMRRLKVRLQPYEIPFHILPELVLTEDARSHQRAAAFSVESLVDVFEEEGKRICWHFTSLGLYNGTDEDRVNALKASFDRQDSDLYFLYLGSLDITAHKYGPLSPQVGRTLNAVDAEIKALFEYMKRTDPSCVLVVLGDHGMAEVENTIDAEALLQQVACDSGITPGKDFKYFLDSTACRLWGVNNAFSLKRESFLVALKEALGSSGYWLEGSWNKMLYGEHIWICREGTLIFPDFFHRTGEPYRGMHGYAPGGSAMHGLGLIYDEDGAIPVKRIANGSLGDVANTLCDLAGVRAPKHSLGHSWLSTSACYEAQDASAHRTTTGRYEIDH